jgi:hypothetical protein
LIKPHPPNWRSQKARFLLLSDWSIFPRIIFKHTFFQSEEHHFPWSLMAHYFRLRNLPGCECHLSALRQEKRFSILIGGYREKVLFDSRAGGWALLGIKEPIQHPPKEKPKGPKNHHDPEGNQNCLPSYFPG